MPGSGRRFVLAAVALPFLLLAMLGLSRAATITVTTLADPSGAPGTCSLRQAMTNANGQNRSARRTVRQAAETTTRSSLPAD